MSYQEIIDNIQNRIESYIIERLGDNFQIITIEADNYNPAQNTQAVITITAETSGGMPIEDLTIPLKINNTSISNVVTDENGIAIYRGYYCPNLGVVKVSVGTTAIYLYVKPYDIDWTEITYTSGYGGYSSGETVKYRVKNNIVEIKGAWKPSSNKSATTDPIAFGSIPSSLAPSKTIYTRHQASGTNTYLLTFDTSGNLKWSRHGTTASSDMPSTSWNQVYIIYQL